MPSATNDIEVMTRLSQVRSRALAAHIVDHHEWRISESSVCRIRMEQRMATPPWHIVPGASDERQKEKI